MKPSVFLTAHLGQERREDLIPTYFNPEAGYTLDWSLRFARSPNIHSCSGHIHTYVFKLCRVEDPSTGKQGGKAQVQSKKNWISKEQRDEQGAGRIPKTRFKATNNHHEKTQHEMTSRQLTVINAMSTRKWRRDRSQKTPPRNLRNRIAQEMCEKI